MKRVLITGGSRGIGAACVRQFAKNGCAVAFVYRSDHDRARQIAQETGAQPICADLGDRSAIGYVLTEAKERLGGEPDVLVNNAGISASGLFTEMTDTEWDRLLAVNLTAPALLSRGVLSGMIKRKAGCIINIGSVWGRVGASCEAGYSATKAGLRGLTLALAKEAGPSGIRVNCVEPGVIMTDMNRCYSGETMAGLADDTPLCRIGTPQEVASLVWYLSSDEAAFVTGQVIGVDGGFSIS